ncbi:MAG: hypothetical protein L6Q98_01550 [Anaerolineae bacterium]|nr:hypothetical protein [Anaerolineae bacterium]NUQ04455.1 hypothetical protein [Anaerolineae bacterium]
MNSAAFSQLLTLYTWFLLAAAIGFLLLIARFYQKFSGERTYYWLYLAPIGLFGVEAVRQTRLQMVDDAVGVLLSAAAGLLLIALSTVLYWRMTSGRKLPEG